MNTPQQSRSGDARPALRHLELTGERTLPDIPDERYWFERHVVAYRLACEHASGRAVLDAGCGEGYGLAMLADAGATNVVGVDLEPAVIDHVHTTYAAKDPRITAYAADLTALALPDGEIDLAVSFQVIEHLHDIPGYLASLRRVTRQGGEIMIATPNRLTFTPGSDVPVNPFHTREFTADELREELTRAGYDVAQMLGVFHGAELAEAEAEMGVPLIGMLTAGPPESWPDGLRALVHRVEADWFDVRAENLDGSLDLIARCVVP